MKINKNGFSIIIWMGLVVLITLSAYVILAYILPFSKNVKWIENASNAYYVSYGWIEEALYYVKIRWSLLSETGIIMPNTAIWVSYSTDSSTYRIPATWEWNSEYDKDYNIISPTEPLQFEIGNNYYYNPSSTPVPNVILSNLEMFFKVPNFESGNSLTLSWWWNYPIINWMISSWSGEILYSSWNQIMASRIFTSDSPLVIFDNVFRLKKEPGYNLPWWLTVIKWVDLFWNIVEPADFYQNNCKLNSCILKMSIINKLQLTNGKFIPYLEYLLDPHWAIIPDRYTKINSSGKSYGFKKDLEVKIPQQTVNQALDFTVFQ